MSDLQIIRQQSVSYGATGQTARSDEVFIKVLESFQDRLNQLKGARLHVFMAHATQESKIVLGKGAPLSLRKMEKVVPYSRPSIIAALDYLVEFNFLTELAERGPDAEKLYRVCSYAWFGSSNHGTPTFHTGAAADVPADPHPKPTGGQNSLPPNARSKNTTGLDSEPNPRRSSKKNLLPSQKYFLPGSKKSLLAEAEEGTVSRFSGVVAKKRVPEKNRVPASPSTSIAETKKILRAAGFYEPALTARANVVPPDRARAWACWIEWAIAHPDLARVDKPAGIANFRLREDPMALPENMDEVTAWECACKGERNSAEEWADDQNASGDVAHETDETDACESVAHLTLPAYPATMNGVKGTAHEVFHTLLGELQLQMTRATFDTWVRPLKVLGFDVGANVLVVLCHSPYAKEWMEHRLSTTAQRTLIGIVQQNLGIQYVVMPPK